MSLKVWLPLNGNLENKGLANVVVTNNGATVNSAGKIGNCYKFGTSASYMDLPIATMSGLSEASVCLWLYINSFNTSWATYFQAGAVSTAWAAYTFGLLRNNSTSKVCFCVSNGSSSTQTSCISPDLTIGKWYHFTLTYKLGHILMYINGELHQDFATSIVPNFASISRITIGKSTDHSNYQTDCSINDVRIYDHCLSPKEVHDIAQALVLHYKLDDTQLIVNCYSYPTFNTSAASGGWSHWGPSGYSATYSQNTDTQFIFNKDNKYSHKVSNTGTVYYICYQYPDFEGGYRSAQAIIKMDDGSDPTGKVWFSHNANVGTNPPNTFTYLGNGFYLMKHEGFQQDGSNNLVSIGVNGGYTVYISEAYLENNKTVCSNIFRHSIGNVTDCSGYGNNGTVSAGSLCNDANTPRYNSSTTFRISMIETPYKNIGLDEFTYSAWIKLNSYVTPNGVYSQYDDRCVISAGINTYFTISSDGKLSCYAYGKDPAGYHNGTTTIPLNTWTHVAVVWTKTQVIGYVNGVQDFVVNCTGAFNRDGVQYIGAQPRSTDISTPIRILDGNISDLRYYATALSENDILRLYNTSAYIDDAGNAYSYDFDECIRNDSPNMLLKVEMALCKKQFANGLSNYQQTHCKCTLTNDGYRIYRTPNLTYPDSGTVMWGGFVLDNASNRFGLQKDHTYVVEFDIKGQTSNAVSDMYWTCQVGWGGGECECHPTNIKKMNPVTANYNSSKWRHVSYKFTVSDDVWKECTANYNSNSFVAGNSYVSYRHFKFGFGYTSTGELGTDLYIKNLRMFDITTGESKMNVTVNGLIESTYVIENDDNAFVDSFGEMNAKTLVEI